ncbi:MAG: hypothetical protein ACREPQ_02570 [Rhodanobacter sp.]
MHFHGPGKGKAWNQKLLSAIQGIVVERRENLNFAKLDGITVSFDLAGAISSIQNEQDVISVREKQIALQHQTVAAGCVMGVMRQERYLSHVFLDATYLTQLVDDPQAESWAANIVAHELAHVDLSHWLTKPAWSYVFPTQRSDWRYETLRYLTLNLWDEYAACRLSARIGDSKPVLINFMNCLRAKVVGGLPRLRLYTRKNWLAHGALKSFMCATTAARRPLLSAAYLMGHIDGLDFPTDVATLSTPARTSLLSACWMPLHQALRDIWERDEPEFGFDVLDELTPVLIEAIRICGGERILKDV